MEGLTSWSSTQVEIYSLSNAVYLMVIGLLRHSPAKPIAVATMLSTFTQHGYALPWSRFRKLSSYLFSRASQTLAVVCQYQEGVEQAVIR